MYGTLPAGDTVPAGNSSYDHMYFLQIWCVKCEDKVAANKPVGVPSVTTNTTPSLPAVFHHQKQRHSDLSDSDSEEEDQRRFHAFRSKAAVQSKSSTGADQATALKTTSRDRLSESRGVVDARAILREVQYSAKA
jgi:hypothetical protein